MRDLPLRDMLSWVRGGWGLDALGKFFRRRRRRRRRPRLQLLGCLFRLGPFGMNSDWARLILIRNGPM